MPAAAAERRRFERRKLLTLPAGSHARTSRSIQCARLSRTVERGEELVVKETVRADYLRTVARRPAVTPADPAARLLDNDRERRVVPAREPRVDGGIE